MEQSNNEETIEVTPPDFVTHHSKIEISVNELNRLGFYRIKPLESRADALLISVKEYDRDKLNQIYVNSLLDWADDDTTVKELVEGLVETENEYEFVGVIDIVESLVELIKTLKNER